MPSPSLTGLRHEAQLLAALVIVGGRYLQNVLPVARRELSVWSDRVASIPDEGLRDVARSAMAKRGNMEAAALFAAFVRREHRDLVTRVLVRFQTIYNYVDLLGEQPGREPVLNGRQLHGALEAALGKAGVDRDYYKWSPGSSDGGFLDALVETCREASAQLPSPDALLPAREAARKIAEFQSLNLTERQGGVEALREWGIADTAFASDLCWWESAAAGGSSLAVNAAVALATEDHVDPERVESVTAVFHPSITAVHSLLDSMVDVEEDRRGGHRNLLSYYESEDVAAARMCELVGRVLATDPSRADDVWRRALATALVTYYLSDRQLDAGGTCVARSVSAALSPVGRFVLVVMRIARRMSSGAGC